MREQLKAHHYASALQYAADAIDNIAQVQIHLTAPNTPAHGRGCHEKAVVAAERLLRELRELGKHRFEEKAS